MVDRNPARPGRGVDECVQQRPVGDRIGSVAHAFRLAVGRRHRPRVKVIAPDHDRCLDRARADQVVECQAGPRPLTVTQPADPGGQPLEWHLRLRHLDPARERSVVRKEVEDHAVGYQDVLRIPTQGNPPEGPFALAEQGPDECRHESRVVEGVLDAGILRHRAEVVAVVEHDRAGLLEGEHRADVVGHRAHGLGDVHAGLPLA